MAFEEGDAYLALGSPAPSSTTSTPARTSFSTWSRALFSTPTAACQQQPSPVSSASSPSPADKSSHRTGDDTSKAEIRSFASPTRSASWNRSPTKSVKVKSVSLNVTPLSALPVVGSSFSTSSPQSIFCCEACSHSLKYNGDFSAFIQMPISSPSTESPIMLLHEVDHLIEVVQVGTCTSPSKALNTEWREAASISHYFAFSKTTRRYREVKFDFFALSVFRPDAHAAITKSHTFRCNVHGRTIFLTRHQPEAYSSVGKRKNLKDEINKISPAATEHVRSLGLGIALPPYSTKASSSTPVLEGSVSPVVLERGTTHACSSMEAPVHEAYGTKKSEQSPIGYARQRRRIIAEKSCAGRMDEIGELSMKIQQGRFEEISIEDWKLYRLGLWIFEGRTV